MCECIDGLFDQQDELHHEKKENLKRIKHIDVMLVDTSITTDVSDWYKHEKKKRQKTRMKGNGVGGCVASRQVERGEKALYDMLYIVQGMNRNSVKDSVVSVKESCLLVVIRLN